MDAENGELFFGQSEEDSAAESWCMGTPFSFSDIVFNGSEKHLEEWAIENHCGLNDSESEDVLHAINPNEVFPSGPPGENLSESDSGMSEEPLVEGPASSEPTQAPATVYQVVYDISSLGNVKTEPVQHNVDIISIELDEWSSQMLISESCVVNELPMVPAVKLDNGYTVTPLVSSTCPSSPDHSLLYPDLQLTEEEQKLLNQEGVSLPNNLPLTKAEERILKKVRRKIRNKQSAQDSRRRRKEYVDGLESRAAACSAQNKELLRTVQQLEKHNLSLMAQLRRLQSLIKQTATKGAQTSTCILIILFSLGLIIIPSCSPFRRSPALEDDYKPKGVISRNILTDPASSLPTSDEADSSIIQTNALPVPQDPSQSGSPDSLTGVKPPVETPQITNYESMTQDESQSGNSSAVVAGRTEALSLVLRSPSGEGSIDAPKPAHADEM